MGATENMPDYTSVGGNKVDEVVESILESIRTGQLTAGDRIPTENELCRTTGISRTSVREALKRLEALTIVQIRRGDGTYISQSEEVSYTVPMTFKMLLGNVTWEEVLEYREMLDFMVMRSAISNADQENIEELRRCHEALVKLSQSTDGQHDDEGYAFDLQFHQALARATKNSIIEDLYLTSYEIFGRIVLENYRAGQTLDVTCIHHNRMLEAVEKRDTMLAAYAAHAAIRNWASWVHKHNRPMYYFMPTDGCDELPGGGSADNN